jgi:predicted methyltransferase
VRLAWIANSKTPMISVISRTAQARPLYLAISRILHDPSRSSPATKIYSYRDTTVLCRPNGHGLP